jgi:hypothetical protein
MFGNGHNSIAQRWRAEDLLLHQSRAANKRLGIGAAGGHRFRSLRSRALKDLRSFRTALVPRVSVLIRSSSWRSNARIAEQKETALIAAGRISLAPDLGSNQGPAD